MTQNRAKQFSVGSNEVVPDEIAQYSVNLYSTTSNGTAFREIAWHTFSRTVQPKDTARREVVQRNIKWHSVA